MVKQIIVIRKDLNMRKGKIAAQASHAAVGVVRKMEADWDEDFGGYDHPHYEEWISGLQTKICVSVDSEAALLALHERSKSAGLLTYLVQDAGLTEFGGVPTYTTLAIGPASSDKIDPLTGHLPLL